MTALGQPSEPPARGKAIRDAARFLCLAWVVPFVLSVVVYYGFTTNYTTGVFSATGFEHRYGNDVYRYRVLGSWLQLTTHRAIERHGLLSLAPRSLKLLDPSGSPAFYTAYFLNNTFFLCLTCSVLFLVLRNSAVARLPGLADALLLLSCLLMTITQYVVVPYDTLSYFFLACGFYLITARPGVVQTAVLGLVVVLGTLTRETAALIPAFFLACHRRRLLARPFVWSAPHTVLALLAGCFAATYAALRLALGTQDAVFQSFRLTQNLGNPFSLAGLTLLGALILTSLLDRRARGEITVFLAASVPYLLSALAVAQPWEIRLWVPILLSILVLKVGAPNSGDSTA